MSEVVEGTRWVPEVGPKVIPAHVEERVVNGVLNRPAVGTRIRATLGETVIVGHVAGMASEFDLIYIRVESPGEFAEFDTGLDMTCWIDRGWQFEILEAAS